MRKTTVSLAAVVTIALAAGAVRFALGGANPDKVLAGGAAFSDARTEKPGTFRHLTPADLPKPNATPGVSNASTIVARPDGVLPQAPAGFTVNLFVFGLNTPRAMKSAPNGDVFVAETGAAREW